MRYSALLEMFPTFAEHRTLHLVMAIDTESVRYHVLEHMPIWGFQLLETQVIEQEWQGVLQEACAPISYDDAAEWLLSNGVVWEGETMVSVEDVGRKLADILLAYRFPGSLDSLLLVGETVSPRLPGIVAQAIGTKTLLQPQHNLPFPSREAIAQALQHQVIAFPWRVSLVVARLEGKQLVDDRFELFAPGDRPTAARTFRKQGSFYLPAGETTVQAILLQSTNGRESERVVTACEFSVTKQPFQLVCEITHPDTTPTLSILGGELKKKWQPKRVKIPDRLPRVVAKSEPVEVAFLVDGSMAEAEFERAKRFVLQIVDALSDERSPARLACVVYGEYHRYYSDGRLWAPDYEVKVQPFCLPFQLKEFLHDVKCLTPFPQDPCDNLELGLKKVRHLGWETPTRHVILIGNSPPHPTEEERRAYDILDAETSAFQNIRWSHELEQLLKLGKVHLSSLWVAPTDSPMPARDRKKYEAFARHVWSELGRDAQFRDLDKGSEERLLKFITSTRHTIQVLDRSLGLPMVKALANVASR